MLGEFPKLLLAERTRRDLTDASPFSSLSVWLWFWTQGTLGRQGLTIVAEASPELLTLSSSGLGHQAEQTHTD